MSGPHKQPTWIKVARGWRENPVFKGEFSRGEAWLWLIENACWRPTRFDINGKTVTLQRGQLCVSRAQLAKAWDWSPSAVERFLTRLKTEQMIEQETGQGKSIVTICNYIKYQDGDDETGQATGQETGQRSDSDRTAKEEYKKDRSIEGREGTRERATLPANLDDAVPADLSDMVSLAQECAAAAGTRQIDPGQIGKDITLCREWTAAGADPPLILQTIREGVAASAKPIFSLRFFDQPIRTAIAKQKALENGTLPNPNSPADLVTARAAERMRQRRAAGAAGLVGLPGGAE